MISRYEVSLNDIKMAELDDRILILDVSQNEPKVQTETVPIAGREGLLVTRRYRESVSVTVTFELHVYSISERQEVCQKVNQWAKNGGSLKTNDRIGQYLDCVCDKQLSITSVKQWTAPLSITFTAYRIPYWQNESATLVNLSGRSITGSMDVNGDGGNAFVSCTIAPQGTLTSVRVACANSFIELSGINVASGSVVEIGYSNGVFRIMNGNTSLMNKRTASSSDDLTVPSGEVSNISVIANVPVLATFTARGLWL